MSGTTDLLPGHLPDTNAGTRPLRVGALVAAVAVVLVVVVLLLTLGYTPPPAFPLASAEPDPARTGRIAMLVSDEDGWCLSTVRPADGHRVQVRCERGWAAIDEVAWTTAGNLALLGYGEGIPVEPTADADSRYSGRQVRIVDPTTGQDLREGTVAGRGDPQWPLGDDRRDDGTRVRVDSPLGGTARVRLVSPDGTALTALEVTGPLDYVFEGAAWSPDGSWILLLDNRQRLLVMPSVGTSPPVVVLQLGRDQWLMAPPAWTQPGMDRVLLDESSVLS